MSLRVVSMVNFGSIIFLENVNAFERVEQHMCLCERPTAEAPMPTSECLSHPPQSRLAAALAADFGLRLQTGVRL